MHIIGLCSLLFLHAEKPTGQRIVRVVVVVVLLLVGGFYDLSKLFLEVLFNRHLFLAHVFYVQLAPMTNEDHDVPTGGSGDR